MGAVSEGLWTGVPLTTILRRADMIASALINIRAFQSSIDATTGDSPDEADELYGRVKQVLDEETQGVSPEG